MAAAQQLQTPPRPSGFNWGRVFRYFWFVSIGWIAVLNAQPYIALINRLSQGIAEVPVVGLLLKVPVLGWLLGVLGALAPGIVAIAVYSLIQLVQCLPMFLEAPEAIRARIQQGEQWQALPLNPQDPEWLNSLKERFNRLPITWVEGLHDASRVAYAIDFVLAGLQYPLFRQGWVAAAQGWSSLGLGDVLWANLPGFLLMVFALEGAIWIYVKFCVGVDLLGGQKVGGQRQ